MSEPRRIALFGGSFDPVHAGHLEIAKTAAASHDLSEVRFVPCRISPHKTGHPPAPAQDRVAMLRLALRQLPFARIDETELHRPPPSYSVDTAEEVHRRHPEVRLFWILGLDQWLDLPAWHRPGRLAELLEFIVSARGGDHPRERPGFRMDPMQVTHPASSSAIRAALAAGTDPPSGWLDPGVLEYLRAHRLYIP